QMRSFIPGSIARSTIPLLCLALLISCSGERATAPVSPPVTIGPQQIPITGAGMPGLEPFENSVANIMSKYGIPGGAFALVRDGKLIYARGFGYADLENKTPVQPDARFRIASVSKMLTSAAIMKLVEEGKLNLEDRVAPIIADLKPAPGSTVDPRWEQITIRQLLSHSGGWDRAKPNGGFDPIDRPLIAAAVVGAPAPASSETLVRYMKGMPLDFNPGEKFAYSNFGFIILGRVIERLSGMHYEDYVRARVLVPVGANRTRQGKSLMKYALPEEVKYYMAGAPGLNWPMVASVFPGEGSVPLNYGGYHLEGGDASGAWVSSTVDLLRFVTAVDGRASPPDILSVGLIAEMTGSGATVCANGSCYYAGGWFIRPVQNGATWWHGGDLPGTKAFVVRSYYNISWAVLFNAGVSADVGGEIDAALWAALNNITSFPTNDLFSSFK
ncbi:MAG TPA: serine hydrolase domain-containing protein, partial [Gemmatimonadaceae bacterium]|nr:serine hydrolase domain-containing protein [Gemmatimonadaceae bacterium]